MLILDAAARVLDVVKDVLDKVIQTILAYSTFHKVYALYSLGNTTRCRDINCLF